MQHSLYLDPTNVSGITSATLFTFGSSILATKVLNSKEDVFIYGIAESSTVSSIGHGGTNYIVVLTAHKRKRNRTINDRNSALSLKEYL